MKIFWSWQSDTPGNTGRRFVRAALDSAVGQIKVELHEEDPEVEDAVRELHVDQDREGIPGFIDLPRAILNKIDEAAIFVCDLTLVGRTDAQTDGDDTTRKYLVNSNVAVELGYALAKIPDARIVPIVNEAYCPERWHELMPFDLRHRSGIIPYRLLSGSDKATRDSEHQQLVERMKPILLAAFRHGMSSKVRPRTQEAYAGLSSGMFPTVPVTHGDLFSNFNAVHSPAKWKEAAHLAVRVIPIQNSNNWPPGRIAKALEGTNNLPLLLPADTCPMVHEGRCRHGYVVYATPSGEPEHAIDFTLVASSGELWVVNCSTLPAPKESWFLSAGQLASWLERYFAFSRDVLQLPPEVTVHIGSYVDPRWRGVVVAPDRSRGTLIRGQFYDSLISLPPTRVDLRSGNSHDLAKRFVGRVVEAVGGYPPEFGLPMSADDPSAA